MTRLIFGKPWNSLTHWAGKPWSCIFVAAASRAEPSPRAYHSGDIGDASAVIDWLQQRFGNARLLTAGFSLGGNMLAQLLANSVSQHLQGRNCLCTLGSTWLLRTH